MKKWIFCLSCLAMVGLLVTLPTKAEYQSADEIAFSLRAISGGYIPEDNPNKIIVSPEDAQNGTILHFGFYIEADYADMACVAAQVFSDSAYVTFNSETYQSPTTKAFDTAQEFTLSDGTVFTSLFQPFCFGKITNGTYAHGSFSMNNTIHDESMNMLWLYDLYNKETMSADFLGSRSDEFSFIEFDVNIAENSAAGTYSIYYLPSEEVEEELTDGTTRVRTVNRTYVASDGQVETMIPTLKNAEIVIAAENPSANINLAPHFYYADDCSQLTETTLPEELTLTYADEVFNVSSSEIDILSPDITELEVKEPVILYTNYYFQNIPLHDAENNLLTTAHYIGLKGDVNQDGEVNAKDASSVLIYAAASGAGLEASLTGETGTAEDFAYFLGDVNGESRDSGADGSQLDAKDASLILQYSAMQGSGQEVDWNQLLS